MVKKAGASTWHSDDVNVFVSLCAKHNNSFSRARKELEEKLATGEYALKSNRPLPPPDSGQFLRGVFRRYQRNESVFPNWNQSRPTGAAERALQVIAENTKRSDEGKPYIVGSTRQLGNMASPPVSRTTIHQCLTTKLALKSHKQQRAFQYANSEKNRQTRKQRTQAIINRYDSHESWLQQTIFSDEKQFVADTDTQGLIRIYAKSAKDIPYEDRTRHINNKLTVHVSVQINFNGKKVVMNLPLIDIIVCSFLRGTFWRVLSLSKWVRLHPHGKKVVGNKFLSYIMLRRFLRETFWFVQNMPVHEVCNRIFSKNTVFKKNPITDPVYGHILNTSEYFSQKPA